MRTPHYNIERLEAHLINAANPLSNLLQVLVVVAVIVEARSRAPILEIQEMTTCCATPLGTTASISASRITNHDMATRDRILKW
jgi:hypothetical protein